MDLIASIIEFFNKFIQNNKKNREYFVIKGGVSLTAKFLDHQYPMFTNHEKLVRACLSTLGNSAISNDNKILLWVLGTIPNIYKFLHDFISQKDMNTKPLAEYALFVLWRASIDCDDVQEELMKRKFLDVALKTIQEHSGNMVMVAFCLAIIRRLSSNQNHKDEVAKNFLYTLMSFVEIFLDAQSSNQQQDLSPYDKLGISFIHKEILGSLGVLAANETHRKEISQNNGSFFVIHSAKLNINKPKLIKTALGCLINLSQNGENKESLGKDAAFY